tara:strand:+ start:6530 stop:7576 length:1047 start_codon:yes stop_codon:yes gene_type:complete
MYYEDENERNAAFYNNADLVVQGVPIEVQFEERLVQYSVAIEKVWKGKADALVSINTALDSAACGITLNIDEPVIIFAYQSDNQYHTGLCSGTAVASDTQVKWLNDFDGTTVAVLPKEQPENEPPPPDCTPYSCKNGDRFSRCEGTTPINYLVHPCQFSNGEGEPENKPEPNEQEESQGFSDVGKEHSNFTSISFVKNEGIVKGYEDGSFKPDQRINRAEFTKIIVAANFTREAIDTCESNDLFSDVLQSNWFADFVCTAKKDGVIDGYPDGTFRPGAFVNFAEAAKIVVGAFGIGTSPGDSKDIWWQPYVFALARLGGLPSTFSDPNQQLTRGDMAEIIYRVRMGME